jgi:hypothetical protein
MFVGFGKCDIRRSDVFDLFLALAILSLIALIVGFIWLLISRGRTTRRRGREAGAEIMTGLGAEDDEAIPLIEKSVFVGTGVKVTRDVEVSFGDIKEMLRDRQWRGVLPALLVIVGLFGLIVFGVLALWLKLDDKFIATVIAAVVLFTMARIGWSFFRA